MKYLLSFFLIVVVWIGVAIPITARIYYLENGGDGSFIDLFISQLPAWMLWALLTPLILLTARILPVRRGRILRAFIWQIIFCLIFIGLYAGALASFNNLLAGRTFETESFLNAAFDIVFASWFFIFAIYWIVVVVAYGLRPSVKRGPRTPEDFDNSILIKTNYGFALVEIEKFQFVEGESRRVMFHTGRTKHLDHKRAPLAKGKLAEGKIYKPDPSIVIDFEKIRSAEQPAPNRFIFHIGYNHELYFNKNYYLKLGNWLPSPLITY